MKDNIVVVSQAAESTLAMYHTGVEVISIGVLEMRIVVAMTEGVAANMAARNFDLHRMQSLLLDMSDAQVEGLYNLFHSHLHPTNILPPSHRILLFGAVLRNAGILGEAAVVAHDFVEYL